MLFLPAKSVFCSQTNWLLAQAEEEAYIQVIDSSLTYDSKLHELLLEIVMIATMMAKPCRLKATIKLQDIGLKAAAAKRPHFAHGCSTWSSSSIA